MEDEVALVVDAGEATAAAERRLRSEAGSLGGGAVVRIDRLFAPGTGEADDLGRFFRVRLGTAPAPELVSAAAFEWAHRLAQRLDWCVEPDLPTPWTWPWDSRHRHNPGSARPTWALDAVRAPQAWAVPPRPGGRARGEGVVVAHPDTGYTEHPDQGGGAFDLARDWDLLDGDDDATDPLELPLPMPLVNPGHGTSTAAVIGGRPAGPRAVVGVAPACTIVPIRAVRSVARVFDTRLAQAVDHARRHRADVISMSLGGFGFIGLRAAIVEAVRGGAIVLAAAGNFTNVVVAPARWPECVGVAATDADDRAWDGTARGAEVLVSAPGQCVHAPAYEFADGRPTAVVDRYDGTSFAVAHVAGAAALWLAHHGPDEIRGRYGAAGVAPAFMHVVRTAGARKPDGWDAARFGAGIVDAHRLLTAPLPPPGEIRPVPVEEPDPAAYERVVAAVGTGAADAAGTAASAERVLRGRTGLHELELAWLAQRHARVRAAVADGDAGWVVEAAMPLASPSLRAALAP